MDSDHEKPGLSFAPFPTTGIWTAIGLSRAAFFVILLGAIGVYLFWGGPVWRHLGTDDFSRIAISYAIIPLAVAIALGRTGRLGVASLLVASGVIAALKLLLTAVLALVFDLQPVP